MSRVFHSKQKKKSFISKRTIDIWKSFSIAWLLFLSMKYFEKPLKCINGYCFSSVPHPNHQNQYTRTHTDYCYLQANLSTLKISNIFSKIWTHKCLFSLNLFLPFVYVHICFTSFSFLLLKIYNALHILKCIPIRMHIHACMGFSDFVGWKNPNSETRAERSECKGKVMLCKRLHSERDELPHALKSS